MKVNQKEIADRLQLSRTTVSRCFTNHPKINPETRARVFELAADLGYAYAPPRNVSEERSAVGDSVAVLIGVPAGTNRRVDTSREILAGVSERLAVEKLRMQVHYLDPAEFDLSPRSRRIVPGMSNSEVRGFILLYPFKESTVASLVSKFPMVCALDDYENLEVDCIDVDQTRGIGLMVKHLDELGHRELAFVSWRYTVPTPWVERRFGAYVEGLYRHDLPFRPGRVINVKRSGQIGPEEVVVAVKRMIAEGVTAVVCAADHQAYPLVKALRRDGIRVPEDVSVTGFDGVEPPEGCPQLTTLRTPLRDIGISTVVSLLRKVSHPAAARRHIMVSGRLIIGRTTAPPRK